MKRKIAIETRVCTKCKKELPVSCFNWRSKSSGTRRSECKYCHSEFMKINYEKKKQIVSDLKRGTCCQKCGDARSYVLDYHHLDPSIKELTVARMTSNTYSLKKTLEEIKKCIVLCSNCHREFHHLEKQQNITIQEYLCSDVC